VLICVKRKTDFLHIYHIFLMILADAIKVPGERKRWGRMVKRFVFKSDRM